MKSRDLYVARARVGTKGSKGVPVFFIHIMMRIYIQLTAICNIKLANQGAVGRNVDMDKEDGTFSMYFQNIFQTVI